MGKYGLKRRHGAQSQKRVAPRNTRQKETFSLPSFLIHCISRKASCIPNVCRVKESQRDRMREGERERESITLYIHRLLAYRHIAHCSWNAQCLNIKPLCRLFSIGCFSCRLRNLISTFISVQTNPNKFIRRINSESVG